MEDQQFSKVISQKSRPKLTSVLFQDITQHKEVIPYRSLGTTTLSHGELALWSGGGLGLTCDVHPEPRLRMDVVMPSFPHMCSQRRVMLSAGINLHSHFSKHTHKFRTAPKIGVCYNCFKWLIILTSMISGFLSPRYGASSGCGWRNGLKYGGQLRFY